MISIDLFHSDFLWLLWKSMSLQRYFDKIHVGKILLLKFFNDLCQAWFKKISVSAVGVRVKYRLDGSSSLREQRLWDGDVVKHENYWQLWQSTSRVSPCMSASLVTPLIDYNSSTCKYALVTQLRQESRELFTDQDWTQSQHKSGSVNWYSLGIINRQ